MLLTFNAIATLQNIVHNAKLPRRWICFTKFPVLYSKFYVHKIPEEIRPQNTLIDLDNLTSLIGTLFVGFTTMLPASSVFWTVTSCSCSTIGVEMHSRQVIGSSFSLFSFASVLFMAFATLAEHPEILRRRQIPIRVYLQIVLIFFVVNVSNNRVLGFSLPFPLIIIFRSSTLIANVLLSWLLQNRTFPLGRLLSVLLVSVGIALFTLFSHRQMVAAGLAVHRPAAVVQEADSGRGDQTDQSIGQGFSFTLGVLVLSCSSFASAYLGIVQENVFMRYGKHPEEMMFFVHLLSLPLFVFVANEIRSDFTNYFESPLTFFVPIPFLSLAAVLFLQLICVRSVYRLASETTSLQVSMTLALRKFLNILFSVVIFKNEFGLGHAIASGFVLLGSFTFYDGLNQFRLQIWKRKLKQ